MKNLYRDLLHTLTPQCTWAAVREVEEKSTYFSVKKGHPAPLKINHDRGVMVEVLVNGQFGYGATSTLTEAGLKQAAQKALVHAQVASPYKIYSFQDNVRPLANGTYQGPGKLFLDSLSHGEVMSGLISLSQKMEGPQILHQEAELMLVERTVRFVSSNGSDFEQSFLLVAPNLLVTAGNGKDVQTRSSGYFANILQQGVEGLNFSKLALQAEKLREEAVQLLSAPDCPQEKMDLILHPDQMYLQIHESIGHPLELDRILGDERNYAGHSFVTREDFGRLQYGSPLLNVVFDPHEKNESASYLFDETGARAQRDYLIKDGVLLRALGGLEAQTRSGVPGTANARVSSWNRPPIDRMANVNVEAGSTPLAEMIGSIERGIFMRTNRSWSIDDYRNKFQFGCEYAQLIENGELTQVVKNPNYRGTSSSFWKSLFKVGDPSTYELWGSPSCGKGEPNQLVRVGHGTPACAFKEVEVFGGGQT